MGRAVVPLLLLLLVVAGVAVAQQTTVVTVEPRLPGSQCGSLLRNLKVGIPGVAALRGGNCVVVKESRVRCLVGRCAESVPPRTGRCCHAPLLTSTNNNNQYTLSRHYIILTWTDGLRS